MSNSLLQVFEGHEIRIVEKGEEFYWVAADVCKAIEIGNVSMALDRLEVDEKGINTIDTLGGSQDLLCVSEPGLYSLVFSSRKPAAKRFKRWVMHEVLPSIRKHGKYELNPAPTQPVRQLAPQRDLLDYLNAAKSIGIDQDPILKSLFSQRMAEQLGASTEPAIVPCVLTVRAIELGVSQAEIGTGSQLGKFIVARGFESSGKSQHGKYQVNCYDRSTDLDAAILNFFDRSPVEVLEAA